MNYRIKNALTQSEVEDDDNNVFTIQLTPETCDRVMSIANALCLNTHVVLESAINYVHFCANKQKVVFESEYQSTDSSKNLPENFKTKKLTLSLETMSKLEKLRMEDKVSECVDFGIKLLYSNLISSAKSTS